MDRQSTWHIGLAGALTVAFTLLVVYASLHPFSGWRDSGAPVLAFLTSGWPRYMTVFDLFSDIMGYLPFGFLCVPALQPRFGRLAACVLTVVLGASLSLSMEGLQNFLPSRVPSNIDLGCNTLGSLLGALLGARWGALLLDGGRLHSMQIRLVGMGAMADAGLILLGLWLFSQLNPEILLFGNGDLRSLLGLEVPLPFVAERFPWIEAGVAASNILAVGLLAGCMLRQGGRFLPAALIGFALVIKTFSLMLLMSVSAGFSWATPGSLSGVAAGLVLWLLATALPGSLQQALAALALLLATALVNLAPENPYISAIMQTWHQGHFLNFNGLTRLISLLWPFLALPYLILMRPEKTHEA